MICKGSPNLYKLRLRVRHGVPIDILNINRKSYHSANLYKEGLKISSSSKWLLSYNHVTMKWCNMRADWFSCEILEQACEHPGTAELYSGKICLAYITLYKWKMSFQNVCNLSPDQKTWAKIRVFWVTSITFSGERGVDHSVMYTMYNFKLNKVKLSTDTAVTHFTQHSNLQFRKYFSSDLFTPCHPEMLRRNALLEERHQLRYKVFGGGRQRNTFMKGMQLGLRVRVGNTLSNTFFCLHCKKKEAELIF